MTIDLDGCPRAYGPEGSCPEAYDYLGNAGYPYDDENPYGPGNWWGVACDESKIPVQQEEGDKKAWPYPGLFISTTAYLIPGYEEFDCRHYVDSERVSFLVVPGNVRMSIPPKFLGSQGEDHRPAHRADALTQSSRTSAEQPPWGGQYESAKRFGLNPYPKEGNAGSSDRGRWLYECWPGKPAKGWSLQ